MFTSRAEYRLKLRQDNCDERLMPLAHSRGFISDEVFDSRQKAWDRRAVLVKKLKNYSISPSVWSKICGESEKTVIDQSLKAFELLKRPEVTIAQVMGCVNETSEEGEDRNLLREDLLVVESNIKYSGFIAKQDQEIKKLRTQETLMIPEAFNYDSVEGLLTESRQKLKKLKVTTLGQASRVQGVTPADIGILALYLAKYKM